MAIGCALGTAGCAGEASDEVGDQTSAIFGGSKDNDSQAIAGVVALRVGSGRTFDLCSGALIAPNVVLTARHCVTKKATTAVSCDEEGRSENGRHVIGDEEPSEISIYIGAAPAFSKEPVATARAIVAPSGPYLCDSDIALVVLDKPVTGIDPLPVRLHAAASEGELIRSVGYGQNDQSSPMGTRFRKMGVTVLGQGKGRSASDTPLGLHEFEVGQSICQGDSGGPAISEGTGAVIGVVSRGGDCQADFGHIYTTTAGFDAMFTEAFALAGASPIDEQGEPATSGATAKSKATPASNPSEAPKSEAPSGCTVGPQRAGGAGAASAALTILAAALALAGRRRRAR